MQNYFRRQWIIIISIGFLAGLGFGIQKLFVKSLDTKVAACEQEQQFYSEEFNIKLTKLNKQIALLKDENRSIKIDNQELIRNLDDLKNTEYELNEKLSKIKEQKLEAEKLYTNENIILKKKLEKLKLENSNFNDLILELQQQIKNYKINSYSLFQAGKLELELSNLDQKLDEQYENITYKKNENMALKEKCGSLRTNTRFCKEYDLNVNMINVMQKQIDHLQQQREDLKQRINVYLSSSNKTSSN